MGIYLMNEQNLRIYFVTTHIYQKLINNSVHPNEFQKERERGGREKGKRQGKKERREERREEN